MGAKQCAAVNMNEASRSCQKKKASVNQVIRLTVDTRSSDENEPMTDTEGTPRGDLARARLGLVFDLPGLIQPARLGVAPIGHKVP